MAQQFGCRWRKVASRSSFQPLCWVEDLHCKSGAPGKPLGLAFKTGGYQTALLINEMSGARQLRLFIQNPVLESSTAPRRWASLKFTSAANRREQMSPW
jgi:hypothetical protein